MKKDSFLVFILLCCSCFVQAQKYYSKTGRITFISEAPVERIESTNQSAYIVLDASTGLIEASVLIKGFQFEKSMMRDHFNENYMESDKFPKGVLKGSIVNFSDVNLSRDGEYSVTVKGDLTLHGVTKPVTHQGKLIVKNGIISAKGSFDILVADFGIKVPKVVRENIARTVKVTVHADLQKMVK